MHILVIDDEPRLRRMLTDFLTQHGHQVELAENGHEGWELISQSPEAFHLILSDIKMPIMDGMGLFEKIHKKRYEIPVILMTGFAEMDVTLKALKLGAFDFLLKPFDLENLLESISKLDMVHTSKKEMKQVLPRFQGHVELSILSSMAEVRGGISVFQQIFESWCEFYKLSSPQMSLCLIEALTNAIIHGNLEISSALKEESWEDFHSLVDQRSSSKEYGERKVDVQCYFDENGIKFEIEDEGQGFDHQRQGKLPPTSVLSLSGRGLTLMKLFMDEVFWNEKGNHITMIKHFSKP